MSAFTLRPIAPTDPEYDPDDFVAYVIDFRSDYLNGVGEWVYDTSLQRSVSFEAGRINYIDPEGNHHGDDRAWSFGRTDTVLFQTNSGAQYVTSPKGLIAYMTLIGQDHIPGELDT